MFLRVGVPAAVGLILFAVLLVEQDRGPGDLQLAAPSVVRPGESIALRSWFFETELTKVGAMRQLPTTVALVDRWDETRASVQLEPSSVGGVEGSLLIPQDVTGWLSLVGKVRADGRAVAVRRPVRVTSRLPEPRPRMKAGFRPGPIEKIVSREAPKHLDARVQGGACVPELPCTLWVWVGPPAASIELEPVRGVRHEPRRSDPTQDLVSFSLIAVGDEARLDVLAYGPSGLAAKRRIEIPLRGGGLAASLDRRIVPVGEAPVLEWVSLVDRPVVLDLYHEGQWTRAESADVGVRRAALDQLTAGRWRVQVRRGIFSSSDAASLDLIVLPENVPVEVALNEAAAHALSDADRRGLDPFAIAVRDGYRPAGPVDDVVRYLSSLDELTPYEQRPATSSRLAEDPEAEAQRARWRTVAAIAVLILGLLTAGFVFVIGMRPIAPPAPPGEPIVSQSGPFRVALMAAAVLLIFVLVAAIALWRGLL